MSASKKTSGFQRGVRALAWKLGYSLFWLYQRLLDATVRVERIYHPATEKLRQEGGTGVLVFWHQYLASMPTCYDEPEVTSVLMSPSSDTALLARFATAGGFRVIFGSSRRGGAEAMVAMASELAEGRRVVITADGPGGPIHVAKTGAIRLARDSGKPIIPTAATFNRCGRLSTWDKLILVVPWSRARLIAGEPIYIPKDTPDSALIPLANELSQTMLKLENQYAFNR